MTSRRAITIVLVSSLAIILLFVALGCIGVDRLELSPPMPSAAVNVPAPRPSTPQPDTIRRSFLVVPQSGIVSLAVDPETNATGMVVHCGNQTGQELYRGLLPVTNTFTVAGLDPSKEWFISVSSYRTVNGMFIEGLAGNEVLFMPSTAPPFIHLTNGQPTIVGYASNAMVTIMGGSLQAMTNVASFTTNGIWRYQENLQNGGRYFKVLSSPQ